MNYFNCAYEGGGAKGISFVGIAKALEKYHVKQKKIVGASAGAVFGMLVALGYKSSRMEQLVLERDENGDRVMSKFLSVPKVDEIGDEFFNDLFGFSTPIRYVAKGIRRLLLNNPKLRHIAYFIENGGWFSDRELDAWLIKVIEGRKFDKNITFKQLYKRTGVFFTVMVTDLDKNRLLAFNAKTAPNVPIRYAVRMSVNIPFIWKDYRVDRELNLKYMNEWLEGYVTDGGVLTNFPINMVSDYESDWVNERMSLPEDKPTDRSIGFMCDESKSFMEPVEKSDTKFWDSPTLARIKRLMSTVLKTHDLRSVEKYKDLIVNIPAAEMGTVEFNFSDHKYEKLRDAAYEEVSKYLDRHL